MSPPYRPRLLGLITYLRGCLSIDTRSLAAFRIIAGVLIVVDICLRARNFTHFYTESGVVPQSVAREAAPIELSVYFLTTDPTLTALLFVVHAIVGMLLIVGYRTRLVTVVAFVFVVSLDLRNSLVLSYADVLFAWLLLWALFLPLGERWSVDAVHRPRSPKETITGIAPVLILGQMVTMYVVNGIHKSTSTLWTSGDAAVLVFGLDDMTFLLAEPLRSVPWLLEAGGLLWYYLLLSAWLLLLIRGRARTLLVSAFVAGHLSFAVTVRIGAFAFVAIAGLVLFYDASFWDDLDQLKRKRKRRFPQSVSNSFNRLRKTLCGALPSFRLRPWDDTSGAQEIYVAVRKYGAAIMIVAAVLAVALAGADVGYDGPGGEIETAGSMFITEQTEWSIFAPNPRTTDYYYVFAAVSADDSTYDLYNDRELSYDRPHEQLQKQYDTYRERFYMSNVAGADPPAAPERLAETLCETWDTDEQAELTTIELYQIGETITRETIDDHTARDRSSRLIYQHQCGTDGTETVPEPSF